MVIFVRGSQKKEKVNEKVGGRFLEIDHRFPTFATLHLPAVSPAT